MNMEFMCCILYGLTEIFKKSDTKRELGKKKSIYDIDFTLNLINVERGNILSNEIDISTIITKKGIFVNDYSKLYNKVNTIDKNDSKEKSLLPNELRK
jgi:hypothetical protein